MRTETWELPAGWIGTKWASDEKPADVQDAILAAFLSAGWTVKNTYRASYRFGLRLRSVTPPATAVPDSEKTPHPCGVDFFDFSVIINGQNFLGYDPYREFPPPPPCVGYPLGEDEYATAVNFVAAANATPYKVDLAAPIAGAPWGFSAVAKEPGARGDAYSLQAPVLTFDPALGEEAYPGYRVESPEDENGLTFDIHFWDGNLTPSYSQANYFHCFRVYDSYDGKAPIFDLWQIFRDRSKPSLPPGPYRANSLFYKYEIIATEDSLCVTPYQRTDLDEFTQEIIRTVDDVYGPANSDDSSNGCLYIARPVLTPEATANGVEASLFVHMPGPTWGYDQMNSLWDWAQWVSLNGMLRLQDGATRGKAALALAQFPAAQNQPQIRTATGGMMQTCVFAMMTPGDGTEAGIVGKLNSVLAVADATYTEISQATLEDSQKRTWKLIFQTGPKNHRFGYYINYSLWMAESKTNCGEHFDPTGGSTVDAPPRAMSAVVNPLHNWTLRPDSESGNDAILFAGGEGIASITVAVQASWIMDPGTYPTGDPGGLYFDVVDHLSRHCSVAKYVRIWGFPTCDQVGHTYNYVLRATDNHSQTIDQTFSITVTEGTFPAIHPPSNTAFTATVGTSAYFYWTVGCTGSPLWDNLQWKLKGTIPAGLTFFPAPGDTSTAGQLVGTPTASGYYEFSITAYTTDGSSELAWGKYKLTVHP